MTDDIAAIAARHDEVRTTTGERSSYCAVDGSHWPCDTEKMRRALDAERALAGRLAGALELRTKRHAVEHGGNILIEQCGLCVHDLGVLAAHKEARK